MAAMANSTVWSSSERRAVRRGGHLRAFRAHKAAADVAAVVVALTFGAAVRLLLRRDGLRLNGLRGRVAALADALSPLSASTCPPGVDEPFGGDHG
jgi:hypothetical protein